MTSIIDVLPTEIVQMIIDIVAFDDNRGSLKWIQTQLQLRNVKSCSRVCKTFLDPCRRHIFYRIDVHGGQPHRAFPLVTSFAKLIANNPEIAHYVRKFGYSSNRSSFGPGQEPFYADQIEPIPPSFKLLNKLRSLTLSLEPRLSWNRVDSSSRSVLLHLLRLPTMQSLSIQHIDEFTLSDLFTCSNLTKLALNQVTISENDILPPTLDSIPTLQLHTLELATPWKSVPGLVKYPERRTTSSSSCLDFGSLRYVEFQAGRNDDASSIAEFLKYTRRFQVLEVRIKLIAGTVDASSFVSAISAASQVISTFNLDVVVVRSSDQDPLYNIHNGLEQISKMKNQIQTLSIRFYVISHAEPYGTLSANSWSHLEKVLLTPGWSSLKQVNLGILHDPRAIEEWSEGDLEEKRQQRFPGLSSSKNLKFKLFYQHL